MVGAESKREKLTNNRNIENFSTLTTWNIKQKALVRPL
jgi:hypothetical protein